MCIRWGIIGSGKIASDFASDLQLIEEAKLAGVFSRTYENAQTFASRFHCSAYPTFEAFADAKPDIVYVATTHNTHCSLTIDLLKRNIPVLVEKPFAMNATEALEMIRCAKDNKVFLMEAMWTRFLPAMRDAIKKVKQGQIGKIESIQSSFGYDFSYDPKSRVYNSKLGGGSLLDVGVYCVSFAQSIVGNAVYEIESQIELASSGVDSRARWQMDHPDKGIVCRGASAVNQKLSSRGIIDGTEGKITFDSFWNPSSYVHEKQEFVFPFQGKGPHFEAQEAMRCLKENKLESDTMPLNDSLEVMKILDDIRSQGLRDDSQKQLA